MIRNTAEAVESNRLLEHLENYERSGLPSDARLLAHDCQFLSVSSGVAQRELGDCFETHYRNANLRVAVSAELLNRMMPKREPEYAPVQDTIQGATVRGQSVTANEISVRMVPDPGLVRMELDVNGEVAAVTRSNVPAPPRFSRKASQLTLPASRWWLTCAAYAWGQPWFRWITLPGCEAFAPISTVCRCSIGSRVMWPCRSTTSAGRRGRGGS